MLEGSHIVYFDRVEANWPYRIHLPVGSHVPLHCTASGKLFLAMMPMAQCERLLHTLTLSRHTDLTITDLSQLHDQLLITREQGVSIDEGEYLDGLISLAVPVFDQHDRICFAIAVHAPTARRNVMELRQYLPAMRRAAGRLSSVVRSSEFHHPEG
jgi:DNA-binding IclR family transcriptional regulator